MASPSFSSLVRTFLALKLIKVSSWAIDKLLGRQPYPRDAQLEHMTKALGDVLCVVGAYHPAAKIALRGLNPPPEIKAKITAF